MKRTARRPSRFVVTGVVALGAAMALSGCVLASPAIISTPYPASDGSEGSITDPATDATIKLQNFLVVAAGKNQPGSLVGAVVNTGTSAVTVQLAVADQDGATEISGASVTADPGKIAQIGPSAIAVTVPSVPQPPGSVLTLVAKTDGGGSVRFTVPVLEPKAEYASLTPTPTPTETPTPVTTPAPVTTPETTGTATASPSASATS